jgi:hypothetical protein
MKPWGPLPWLLGRLPARERPIYVLASLASEDRCTSVPAFALGRGIQQVRLLDIQDPPSPHSPRIGAKKQGHFEDLSTRGLSTDSVTALPLLGPGQDIADYLSDFLRVAGQQAAAIDLWLDISCLPKRFFFLLIKLALRHRLVETLVVTYTEPAPGRYTEDHLAEDPDDVRCLPGFGPLADEPDAIVVALGFEPLGLPQLLGEYRNPGRRIVFILPFPPGQPYSRRVWQSVVSVSAVEGGGNVRRLAGNDGFGTYAELRRLFDPALDRIRHAPPALAPYGPKPMSVGMCLYAIETGSPVFYTQPRRYHPDYTIGVGRSWGYCLKLEGQEVWRGSGGGSRPPRSIWVEAVCEGSCP